MKQWAKRGRTSAQMVFPYFAETQWVDRQSETEFRSAENVVAALRFDTRHHLGAVVADETTLTHPDLCREGQN